MQKVYQTTVSKLAGTDYREISHKARAIYKEICSKTKRKPYIRSAYFNKEKVFLDYFWQHIHEKNQHDRLRRLAYYACALELINKTKIPPTSVQSKERRFEILHRFEGQTREKETFFVQIKENLKNGQKHFLSVFPFD